MGCDVIGAAMDIYLLVVVNLCWTGILHVYKQPQRAHSQTIGLLALGGKQLTYASYWKVLGIHWVGLFGSAQQTGDKR